MADKDPKDSQSKKDSATTPKTPTNQGKNNQQQRGQAFQSASQTPAPSKPVGHQQQKNKKAKKKAKAGLGHANTAGKTRKGCRRLHCAISLLALIVAIGVGFFSYVTWQQTQHVQQQLKEQLAQQLQGRLEGVASEQEKLAKQMQSVVKNNQQQIKDNQTFRHDLDEDMSQVATRMDRTQRQVNQLADDVRGGARYWQLKQAESLLIAANRQLRLTGNVQQSQQALELANKKIRTLNDPALLPARSAIVDSITQLQAVNQPDIENIALNLSAMLKQVPKLVPDNEIPDRFKPQPGGVGSQGHIQAGWQRFKATISQALDNVVSIERTDGEVRPALLAPKEVYFLRQNLMLELRSARLAALNGQAALYQQNLKTAQAWLKRYFDTEQSAVAGLVTQLNQLETIKLDPELPDISAGLIELRRYLQNNNRPSTPDSNKGGEDS